MRIWVDLKNALLRGGRGLVNKKETITIEPYPSFLERAEEFRIKSPSYCRGIFLQIHSAEASSIP